MRTLLLVALVMLPVTADAQLRLASPDRRNVVLVDTHEGKLYYRVQRDSLRTVDSSRSTFDTTWTQPWDEVSRIRDHHNELKVSVEETTNPNRKFTLAKTVPGGGLDWGCGVLARP